MWKSHEIIFLILHFKVSFIKFIGSKLFFSFTFSLSISIWHLFNIMLFFICHRYFCYMHNILIAFTLCFFHSFFFKFISCLISYFPCDCYKQLGITLTIKFVVSLKSVMMWGSKFNVQQCDLKNFETHFTFKF